MTKQLTFLGDHEGVQIDALVRHRLHHELIGVIVWLDAGRAKIALKTWPDAFYRAWFETRPMPVLVDNLILAE